MNTKFEYSEVTLEKFRLMALVHIDEKMSGLFAEKPVLTLSAHDAFVFDSLVFRLEQAVWGENLDRLDIVTPATWWDMLKKQHAPEWFKRRFPVRYNKQRYDMRCVYPKISFPEQEHRLMLVRQ